MRCNPTSAAAALATACHWIRAGKILDNQISISGMGLW
jgi:hypothetical protein